MDRVEDGRTLSGYLAAPSGASGLPGVVLIQEWWGLNEHVKDVTRRLAAEGFVVLAPDLYDGVVVTEPDEARKLVMELDMATAVAEIQAAVDHLAGREDVSGEQYGAVGFCMGGRLVLRTAMEEERLGAVIPFCGLAAAAGLAAQVAVADRRLGPTAIRVGRGQRGAQRPDGFLPVAQEGRGVGRRLARHQAAVDAAVGAPLLDNLAGFEGPAVVGASNAGEDFLVRPDALDQHVLRRVRVG